MPDKRHIGIREFKNQASRIVDEVRERDEEYVVTRRGEPVAVLRPWSADDESAQRIDRVRRTMSVLSGVAERIALAADQQSAQTAVSGQRR